jgi:hypothetical protein
VRKQLERWRALPAEERWVLVKLAILVPAVGGAVRLFGLVRTYRLLSHAGNARVRAFPVSADIEATAKRMAWLVDVVSRYGVYRATCLRRSLALWWWLRHRGFPAELRIGVGKRAVRMEAHAWVEVCGRVVNGDPAIADEYAAYRDLGDRLPNRHRAS